MGNTKYESVDILVLFTFGIGSSSVDDINGGKVGRGESAGTTEERIYPWLKLIWEEEGWIYMMWSWKLLSERRGTHQASEDLMASYMLSFMQWWYLEYNLAYS